MDKNYSTQTMDIIGDLYARYSDDVKRVFVNYTHDMMTAEDMTHDLYIKIMALDIIRPETAKNLLLFTARRMIIDEVRHRSFVRSVEDRILYESDHADNHQLMHHIETRNLEELEVGHLRKMPRKRSEVYQLWRMNDLSTEEIAIRLHLSKRTVESHIYHSVKDMRDYFRHIV